VSLTSSKPFSLGKLRTGFKFLVLLFGKWYFTHMLIMQIKLYPHIQLTLEKLMRWLRARLKLLTVCAQHYFKKWIWVLSIWVCWAHSKNLAQHQYKHWFSAKIFLFMKTIPKRKLAKLDTASITSKSRMLFSKSTYRPWRCTRQEMIPGLYLNTHHVHSTVWVEQNIRVFLWG
jgi:hypothetical protein